MGELFLDLEPKIFETSKKYFYIGKKDILSIKKEKLDYKNKNLANEIKKYKSIPKKELKLNETVDYGWIYMYYNKELVMENYEIGILDYGIKDEFYEKDFFSKTYIIYETDGVWVDKTEKNKLKIWCERGKEDMAIDVLFSYLDFFHEFRPKFFEKEETGDKVDIFLFLQEKKKIEIEMPNKLYNTIRGIRVEIKK